MANTSDPQLEFAKDVRAYVLDYIKVSDAKAGAALTVIGLIGAVVGSIADSTIRQALSKSFLVTSGVVGVAVVVVISIVGAAICTLHALRPRTPDAKGSLASFPDIVKTTQADYVERVASLDSSAAASEYALHAWTLSNVALEKFKNLTGAINWLRVATIAMVVFVTVHAGLESTREQEATNIRILSPGR